LSRYLVVLSTSLLAVGGCRHIDEPVLGRAPAGAPPAQTDLTADLELAPCTSGIPLDGVRVTVTPSAIVVGDDGKQVVKLELILPREASFVIAPLRDELRARVPDTYFERPEGIFFVDRRTPFDLLTRVLASAVLTVKTVRFAGAGDARVDELFYSTHIPPARDRELFIGVREGAAFVDQSFKHCHGDLPPPNVPFAQSAPDRGALRRALGPEPPAGPDGRLAYSVMVRAAAAATFGEVAAVVEPLSHEVRFATLGFCFDPREQRRGTP
jgi:hypothetical protein